MGDVPVLDLEKYPTAKQFVAKCNEFFNVVQNLYDDKVPPSFSFWAYWIIAGHQAVTSKPASTPNTVLELLTTMPSAHMS